MRPFLAFVLLAAAVSCSGPEESPQARSYERPEDSLAVEASASVPLQYLAWCVDEQKAVGTWTDSASDARSAGSDHVGKRPAHRITLLWRQRP
jgi:hypothetical protein